MNVLNSGRFGIGACAAGGLRGLIGNFKHQGQIQGEDVDPNSTPLPLLPNSSYLWFIFLLAWNQSSFSNRIGYHYSTQSIFNLPIFQNVLIEKKKKKKRREKVCFGIKV